MTPEQLQAIRERAEKVTFAWDMEFIAHVKQDIQTLLAEVKRLQIVASTLAVERNLARDAIKGLEALAKQLAEALPDSQKLRMLAEHFDIKYAANPQDDEVQRDLRLWAQTSETALATYETAMGEKA